MKTGNAKGGAKPKNKTSEIPQIKISKDSLDFPIVGIGASAGGLEALELFFANVPKNSNLAYVVIQHLDPTRESITPQLLQRVTPMTVLQVIDGVKVNPNHIYIIPPNKSLSLLNGSLHLFDPVERHGLRLPIDIFFRSLANDRKEKSIGIILSGLGSDGSIGLKAIKEANGVVLVQDPATAKFDGMPRSAIEAVIVDIVAPAEELPVKLAACLNFTPGVIPFLETEKVKSGIDKIIILLREHSGHDFSLYKKSTLFRRIERRKGIHQIDKIQDYVRFLQENPREIEILFRELLIGVTCFFRDPAVWKKLKENILPNLIKDLPDGYQMRAWVPGCSTGEEAYSLAIVFKEVMSNVKKHRNITLQIFATDLDSYAIEKARKGLYSLNIEADVSPERLGIFFTCDAEGYHISSSIREMIVFAPQNVIKDPPFTKLDILLCRNMLIYMEQELQNKLLTLFNYSLKPNGIMLLGIAETVGNQIEKFKEIDGKLRIYRRTKAAASTDIVDFPSSFRFPKTEVLRKKESTKSVENIQTITEQILLQQFIPASVLVNDKGDILYTTGNIGKYLELVAGKANWNIHVMARNNLRNELPGIFRKALKSFDPIILRNIRLEVDGGILINATVQCIENPESIRGLVLIVLNDASIPKEQNEIGYKAGEQVTVQQHKELEIELKHTREELQSTREEMQTSQEELRSINEELQSSNEEIQSANEELTTSKEEMQSLNEELQTVNMELQGKVNDLMRMNDDMKNLLNSTEIATLFLDKELNIRRYTDLVVKIIKLRDTDIGRPFTDLVTDLRYPDIEEHARQVLRTLITIETAISTEDGRWFNVRIMPYRTLDDHIDGLVITFLDITEAKKMEMELKKLNDALGNANNKI